MKVVHLNTQDFGGAAMAGIHLHRELLKRGVDSVFLTLGKSRNDIEKHVVVNGFELSRFPKMNRLLYKFNSALIELGLKDDKRNNPQNAHLKNRPEGREIFSLPYSFFNILDHPDVKSADIIHLNWVSFGMIDYEKFFANCRQNVVWTMHDMNPFTAGCHHADNCILFQKSCNHCPQLQNPEDAIEWFDYKLKSLSSVNDKMFKLITPSAWLNRNVGQSTLMKRFHSEVIPNGFDSSVFRIVDRAGLRTRYSLPTDRILLLFNAYDVSNKRKGIGILKAALAELKDRNVALVCIGKNISHENFGVDAYQMGYLNDQKAIADLYNACDYFVLPSIAENLPNTISESLLCGTPVIAFNVGGIAEQVTSKNGILIEQISSENLKEALDRAIILRSEFISSEISREAQLKYDIKQIADQYMAVYKGFGK